MQTASLPTPRGELSSILFDEMQRPVHRISCPLERIAAGSDEQDLHLALYCMYELHYQGFTGVDPEWEWEPSLLQARRVLERRFERELREAIGPVVVRPDEVADELWRMARSGDGPSLSEWVRSYATVDHVRELFKHRSAYQLKEADPHTWGIPHLAGPAKAVLVSIQSDEYGNGEPDDMHSTLFGHSMRAVGLDPIPNLYLDELPVSTIATTNLVSMLGLHRRLRGALAGHLALFEMTSTGPMNRYSDALRRLGIAAPARRFFDIHVIADEVHQHLAVEGMVGALMAAEPQLASDVVMGARMLSLVEQRFALAILEAWTTGRSSLRVPAKGLSAAFAAAFSAA